MIDKLKQGISFLFLLVWLLIETVIQGKIKFGE